ncbi:MAG: long-chain fatty acid--CoA ligase [Treponema sp.]|nr:long-chain fatty acid--CoA ligase [Treponema sp.]
MERTLPKIIREVSQKHPDVQAQLSRGEDKEFYGTTYKEMFEASQKFAGGLLSLGTKREEKIGLISDNRKEWEQSDIGLLSIGAIDVPRGCDASVADLKYILSFTEVTSCIVENSAQIEKIMSVKDDIPTLKRFIIFDQPTDNAKDLCKKAKIDLYHFDDIIELGTKFNEKNPGKVTEELEKGDWDDIAGIIFTSGTTGTPKGVMLSHGNFITQLDELDERIYLNPGDRALCVLPVWHVFQRLVEYVILNQAATICYSKPIGAVLLPDLAKLNPHLLPAVPRVFEAVYEGVNKMMRRTGGITYVMYSFFVKIAILHSRASRRLFRKNFRTKYDYPVLCWIFLTLPWLLLSPLKALGNVLVYKKIRAKLGTNFRAGVAGGGAYAKAIDEYFWAMGVNVVEGYGMTETAPVVAVRPVDAPVFGCIGTPIRGVSARIVDMEGNILGKGKKGVLQVKGGTVMKGYYKRPDLTNKILSADGWLDTGDLAIEGVNGELKILGRVKDTIVLNGGENVEPLPIENKLNESKFIETSVLVGQDQRSLGALIYLNKEEAEIWAKQNNISYKMYEDLLKKPELYAMIEAEIRDLVNSKNGFRAFERISKFTFLPKPFEIGKELSAKQEIMRYKIQTIYEKEIKELFK